MGIIKPFKLLLISFMIWVFFYLLTPVKYLYDGSAFYPILVLVFYILFFFFGLNTVNTQKVNHKKKSSNSKIKQILFVLFLVGFIGVMLKLYVGFFKSGIFNAQNIFEKRLENMDKELSGGAIGIIASILYPFSFITILIAFYNFRIINKLFLFIIVLVGLFPFIENYFMGGRTMIALLGTTMILIMYFSFFKNFTINFLKIKFYGFKFIQIPKFLMRKIIIIPSIIIVVLFTIYSIKVVNDRYERFKWGKHTIRILEDKNGQWVKFDEDFKTKFYTGSKEERGQLIGLFNLKHYFAHGVIEYVRLVNHLDKKTGYYYGEYEFNVFFKFFKALGFPMKSFKELNEVLSRKSVYSTFWGPFYLDFGLFGIIVMFVFGRIVKKIYSYAKLGLTEYVIFYAYLSTILFTSFFINFLLGSSSYFLFAFIITVVIFKYWPNKLVVKV